jgi:hypothetical protein
LGKLQVKQVELVDIQFGVALKQFMDHLAAQVNFINNIVAKIHRKQLQLTEHSVALI